MTQSRQSPRGQFTLPMQTYQRLRALAKESGRSMSWLVTRGLERYVFPTYEREELAVAREEESA